MHHHQNQQKEAAKKTSPADQLRLIPGPTSLFFFSGCLSQQFPSLKLTAKAPENGGPLQKIRFLNWKPPFSGGGFCS